MIKLFSFLHLNFILIFAIVLINNLVEARDLPNTSNEARLIISQKQEAIVGKIWLHQLRKAKLLALDPVINAYINNIGNSLLHHGKKLNLEKFNFFALSGNEINAMAFFGENIGIFYGLISETKTESELAAILAHEISHASQKHFARQLLEQKKLTPITVTEALLAIAAGVPHLVGTILGGHIQQVLAFSREYEKEADRIGLQLLNKSNFDPRAMITILERLNKYQDHNEAHKLPEYLSTHPMFESRIPDLHNRLEKLSYKQYKDSLNYDLIKAKVNVEQLNLNNCPVTSRIRSRLTQIEKKLQKYKFHKLTALKYEQALLFKNLYQNQQAQILLESLESIEPENIIIKLSLIELLKSTQELEKAKIKLAKLIDFIPDYLPLTLYYADLLIELNALTEAKNILSKYDKNQIYDLCEEPMLYELLIKCYQKLNIKNNLLFTQAKLLIIHNDLEMAKDKLNQAINVSKNPYEKNIIKKFQSQLEQFIIDLEEIKL